jgi:hypothetical protein
MKTILLIAVAFLFTSHQVNAQIGIQAGVVGVFGEAYPTDDGTDFLGGATGYTLGLFYSARISNILIFQPSLSWLNKGWKDELDDGFDITETKMSVNYLEIPLQLVYKQQKASGFFAGIGPSVFYGISGTRTVTVNGNETSSDHTFGDEEGQEKPLTIGFNAMVGYSFGRIQVHLNYGQGLTNNSDTENQGIGSHLALRIGYIFGVN